MLNFDLHKKKKFYNFTFAGHKEGHWKAKNFIELLLKTSKDVRFGDLTFCLGILFETPGKIHLICGID